MQFCINEKKKFFFLTSVANSRRHQKSRITSRVYRRRSPCCFIPFAIFHILPTRVRHIGRYVRYMDFRCLLLIRSTIAVCHLRSKEHPNCLQGTAREEDTLNSGRLVSAKSSVFSVYNLILGIWHFDLSNLAQKPDFNFFFGITKVPLIFPP